MWKDLERSGEWKRREGKRGERKDPQEAILILNFFCTSQTPDRPPLAAILVVLLILLLVLLAVLLVISLIAFLIILVVALLIVTIIYSSLTACHL